jgi:hypothetical protein
LFTESPAHWANLIVVKPRPPQGPRVRSAEAERRRTRLGLWVAVAFAGLATLLFALRWDEISDALTDFPAWSAAAAVAAHLGWLWCRGEAWRVSLNAVVVTTVPRPSAHFANAAAFLAGVVQSAMTVPVRALALRRLAPERSPSLERTLVADAPVLVLEATLMGLVLVAAVLIAPDVPRWVAGLTLAGGLSGLAILLFARERFDEHGLAAGLRVLGDRRRRIRLLALAVAMVGLGLTRSWVVLAGFDLPHGFASVAVFLAALGVLGALPIGPTSTPAAALAVFGAIDTAKAAGAGIAVAATSLTAISLYGAMALAAAHTFWRRRSAAGVGALAGSNGGSSGAGASARTAREAVR